jgi:hypothetical protein
MNNYTRERKDLPTNTAIWACFHVFFMYKTANVATLEYNNGTPFVVVPAAFYSQSVLQIRGCKSGMLCYPPQHFGSYFIAIMERKNIILPTCAFKGFVGTCLPLYSPPYAQESRQNTGRFS